ncbi:MAG: adenosine-specific kinase [Conexivisphaerales archaeon]
MSLQLKVVDVKTEGYNVILAQSHFIKTVEDVYEALTTAFPGIKFGIAFNESSGDRLIRHDGTEESCKSKAIEIAKAVSAGHLLVIVLKDAYPINIMNRLKEVQEVAGIYCATANPLQVIVAETEQGRGVMGVIDGNSPLGVEDTAKAEERKSFLRKIGYKR